MKLLIAIPAYNEEAGIEHIIRRTLTARSNIIANSPVTEVEITVVSDGSTDRTVEIAKHYINQINLIVFERNRGYGAAIKEAWSQSDAELLGFMDADGTCDPNFFSELCNTLEKEKADIVLGCRLNRNSKMPLIRWIGNLTFALMLTLLSSRHIRDIASGIRVVRRMCLPKLWPLPDGLHFTPAMSARAILGDGLKILEIDMPYYERQGKSKLRILTDGIRFMGIILRTSFLYRPSRPLSFLGVFCSVVATGLMITPMIYYLKNYSVVEWMIYRFVISHLVGTSAFLLFCISYLSRKIVEMTLSQHSENQHPEMLFLGPFFWLISLSLMFAGGMLVLPSFLQIVITGATYEHWSRFIVMSFLFSVAIILIITRILDYTLELIALRLTYLRSRQIQS